MRTPPGRYADALLAAIDERGGSRQAILTRFVRTVLARGDGSRLPAILAAVERALAKRRGGRWVEIAFARDPGDQLEAAIRSLFTARDHITYTIDSSLVAGVRITVDGEEELDASLARKLRLMLPRA